MTLQARITLFTLQVNWKNKTIKIVLIAQVFVLLQFRSNLEMANYTGVVNT